MEHSEQTNDASSLMRATPRYYEIYAALLNFCRARLALMQIMAIQIEGINHAVEAAGIARRATLSELVKMLKNYGVDNSVISDTTTKLGSAYITQFNMKKLAHKLATNIEIHLDEKQQEINAAQQYRRAETFMRAEYARQLN